MKIQYIGHSTIFIVADNQVIVDPYLKGEGREGLSRYNPHATYSLEEINPDLILLTHGHGDHFGQTLELLEKTDAHLSASHRVCEFVNKRIPAQQLIRIEPDEKINIGPLTLSAQKAQHRHGLEGLGGDILGLLAYKRYLPCGTNMSYVISMNGKTIFHSGDTHIVKGIYNPDVAFLSMDGMRTLNEEEAVDVIREMCPTIAVPIHYKWHDTGEKIVEGVKKRVNREKIDVRFKEMKYGEILEI